MGIGLTDLAAMAFICAAESDFDSLPRVHRKALDVGDDGQKMAVESLVKTAEFCVRAAAILGGMAVMCEYKDLDPPLPESTSSETVFSDPLKGVEHPQLGS